MKIDETPKAVLYPNTNTDTVLYDCGGVEQVLNAV